MFCMNANDNGNKVQLQSVKRTKVTKFMYLVIAVQSNGKDGREVKKNLNRVKRMEKSYERNKLRDKKISAKVKGNLYFTGVRPAMLYGLETMQLIKRHKVDLGVVQPNLMHFSI